jgi:hypothetical protein
MKNYGKEEKHQIGKGGFSGMAYRHFLVNALVCEDRSRRNALGQPSCFPTLEHLISDNYLTLTQKLRLDY